MSWWVQYIGIPYAPPDQPEKGLDCWGLVQKAFKDQRGIDIPSLHATYSVEGWGRSMLTVAEQLASCQLGYEPVQKPQAWDIAIYACQDGSLHAGVVLAGALLLHTRKGTAASVESLNAVRKVVRLVGYYKLIEGKDATHNRST